MVVDRLHLHPPPCFQSQISVLQNRIEQLEQLLEENHQIISHIKDSVLELTDTGAISPSGHLPFRSANGSWVLPFDGRPTFLSVKPMDCQFAVGRRSQTDLQVRIKTASQWVGVCGEGLKIECSAIWERIAVRLWDSGVVVLAV